jgi:hypothetical protein
VLDKFDKDDKVSIWTQLKMMAFVFITFIISLFIVRLFPRFI